MDSILTNSPSPFQSHFLPIHSTWDEITPDNVEGKSFFIIPAASGVGKPLLDTWKHVFWQKHDRMLVSFVINDSIETLVVLMAKAAPIGITELLVSAKGIISPGDPSEYEKTSFRLLSSRIESDLLLCDDSPSIYDPRIPAFTKQSSLRRLGCISMDTNNREQTGWATIPPNLREMIQDFSLTDSVIPLADTHWGTATFDQFAQNDRHTLKHHFGTNRQYDEKTGIPFFNHLIVIVTKNMAKKTVKKWDEKWPRRTNLIGLPRHLWSLSFIDQNWLNMNFRLTKLYFSEGSLLMINPTFNSSDLILSYWVQHLIDESQIKFCKFLDTESQETPTKWLELYLDSQLHLINLAESYKNFIKGFIAWEGPTSTLTEFPYEICGQEITTKYPGKFARFVNPSEIFREKLRVDQPDPSPGFSPLGETTTRAVYKRLFESCPVSTYDMLSNLLEKIPFMLDWIRDRITVAFQDFNLNIAEIRRIKKWFDTQRMSGNEEQIRIMNRPNCRRFDEKDWSMLVPRDLRQVLQLSRQLPATHIPAEGNDASFQSRLPVELFKFRLRNFITPVLRRVNEGLVPQLPRSFGAIEMENLVAEVAALPETSRIARERGRSGFQSNPEISDEQLQIFFQEANEKYNALKEERMANQQGAPVGWPCNYGYTTEGHFQAEMQRIINFHGYDENLTFDQIKTLFHTNNVNQEQLDGETDFSSDMERGSDYSFAPSENSSAAIQQDQRLSHAFFSHHLSPPRDLRTMTEKVELILESGVRTDWANIDFLKRMQDMVEKASSLRVLPERLANQIKGSPYFEWLSTIKKSRSGKPKNFRFDIDIPSKNMAVLDLLFTRAVNQYEQVMPSFGHVQAVYSATMPQSRLKLGRELVARFNVTKRKSMVFQMIVDRPGMILPGEATIMFALSYADNLEHFDYLPLTEEEGFDDMLLPFINPAALNRPREEITPKIWEDYRTSSRLNLLLMDNQADTKKFCSNLVAALKILESKNILPIFIAKNDVDSMYFQAKTNWHGLVSEDRQQIPPYILISPPTVSEKQVQTLNDAFSVKENIALHSRQSIHNVRNIKQLAIASSVAFPRFVSIFVHKGKHNQMSLVPSGMMLQSFFLGPWSNMVNTHGTFDHDATIHRKIHQILNTRPIPAPKLPTLPSDLIEKFDTAPDEAWEMLNKSYPLHFEALRMSKDMYRNQHSVVNEKEKNQMFMRILNAMRSYSPPPYRPLTYEEVSKTPPNLVIPTFTDSSWPYLGPNRKIEPDYMSFVDSWSRPYDQDESILYPHSLDSPLAWVMNMAKSIYTDVLVEEISPVSFFPSSARMCGYQPDVQEETIDIDWNMTNGLHAVNMMNLTSWGLQTSFNFVLDPENLFPMMSCAAAIMDSENEILVFEPLPEWESLLFMANPSVNTNIALTNWHKLSAECMLEMGTLPVTHLSAQKLNEDIQSKMRWSMEAIEKMRSLSAESEKMTYNWNVFCPMLPSHVNPPFSFVPTTTIHYPWLDQTISPRDVFANVSPENTFGGDNDEDLSSDDFTQSTIYSNYVMADALIIFYGMGMKNNPVLARILNPLCYFFRQNTPPHMRMVKERTFDSRAKMIQATWQLPKTGQQWSNSLYMLSGTDLRQISVWCRQIEALTVSDAISNPRNWNGLLHDKHPPTLVVDSDVWTRTNEDFFFDPNL